MVKKPMCRSWSLQLLSGLAAYSSLVIHRIARLLCSQVRCLVAMVRK